MPGARPLRSPRCSGAAAGCHGARSAAGPSRSEWRRRASFSREFGMEPTETRARSRAAAGAPLIVEVVQSILAPRHGVFNKSVIEDRSVKKLLGLRAYHRRRWWLGAR